MFFATRKNERSQSVCPGFFAVLEKRLSAYHA